MSRQDDLKRLITEQKRHLQILKEQAAGFGSLHVPTHIVTQIQDREAEVEKLQTELAELEKNREDTPPPVPTPILSRRVIYAVGVILLVIVAGSGVWFWRSFGSKTIEEPNAAAAAVELTPSATNTTQTSELGPSTPLPAASPTTSPFSTPTTPASPTSTTPPSPTKTSTPTDTPTDTPSLTPQPPTHTPPLPPTATEQPIEPSPPTTPAIVVEPSTDITQIQTAALPTTIEFRVVAPTSTVTPTYGMTEFTWLWMGEGADSLPDNYGFEIRVWRDDEQPAGVHNAVLDNEQGKIEALGNNTYRLEVDIANTPGVLNRGGEYNWTVYLVQISPEYEDLDIQAPPGRLRFEASGGGGSSGGGGGDGGGSKPNPPK